ncbi:MAG: CHAT domain-containing protein [Hormoscilla sp.]
MVAISKYRDFILEAEKVQEDDYSQQKVSVRVLKSPAGESIEREYQSVPSTFESNLERDLRLLKECKLKENEIIELGNKLADIIFPNGVRDLYRRSFAALRQEEALRLVLRLDAHLANIPWEYLNLPESEREKGTTTDFLALNKRISIVRYEAVLNPPGDLEQMPKNRRLLVALASPTNDKPLNVAQEYINIKSVLNKIPGIYVESLRDTTVAKMFDQLMTGVDIFHFAGHGNFKNSEDTSGGEIVLVSEDGKSASMSAEKLAINLRNGMVQLVVLNACETGSRDEQNVRNGVVAKLIKVGIPAIVAMQDKIWDESAIDFSKYFYKALAAGLPLDSAVSEGRLAVYNLCKSSLPDKEKKKYWRDWGVPVLYWRGEGTFVLPAIGDINQPQPVVDELERGRDNSQGERHPIQPRPRDEFPRNPFGKKGRITNPKEFFGRKELLDELFEKLARGVNCSLVGESEIGKSSILSMVCHWGPEKIGLPRLPPDAFIYLDMQIIHHEDQFFQALCDELKIETCRGYELARALRGKRYILCIDEIEKMTRQEHFTGDERSELRGLAEGDNAPFKLAIASRSPLNALFPDSDDMTSPLDNICRQLNVGPFSEKEAREFLNHRLRGTGVFFTDREIDELVQKSECHPARLQEAAAELYDRYTAP